MCGIAGVYGLSDEAIVRQMVKALAHRGPDDEGVWSDPAIPVALGHRRLSIIDLSPAAHQPMSYANSRYWITFNGEIYNYRELRTELQALGCVFRTHSDTEVIFGLLRPMGGGLRQPLARYVCLCTGGSNAAAASPGGPAGPGSARHQAALVFGCWRPTFFTSELRGLAASGHARQRLDSQAVVDYLAYGSIVEPRTILKGVQALPAGSWMEIHGRERRIVKYWDLHEATASLRSDLRNIDEAEAVPLLRKRLEEATRYHLVADVAVGSFLSGGLDSSAIASLMSRVAGTKVKTFTVGFEPEYGDVDERAFARLVADRLGTEHQEVVVKAAEFDGLVSSFLAAADQPSADGINTWIVSRAARQYVPVALSGVGGDELFAGYGHFAVISDAARRKPRGDAMRYAAVDRLRKRWPLGSWGFRQLMLAAQPAERLAIPHFLLPFRRVRLLQPKYQTLLWARLKDGAGPWSEGRRRPGAAGELCGNRRIPPEHPPARQRHHEHGPRVGVKAGVSGPPPGRVRLRVASRIETADGADQVCPGAGDRARSPGAGAGSRKNGVRNAVSPLDTRLAFGAEQDRAFAPRRFGA